MKRTIILIAIVAFGISLAAAQETQTQQSTTTTTTTTTSSGTVAATGETGGTSSSNWYLGFEFLPTFTHINVTPVDNGVYKTNFVLGYGGGAILGYNVSDHFALQGEILYNALSQKYTDEQNIERRIDLNYINVPLMMVLNTNVHKPVNLNIAFGPQLGLNVGSKVRDTGGSTGVDTVAAVVAVKTGDLGIAYGAGIDFGGAGPIVFGVGFRGVLGLVDISDNSQSQTTDQYILLDRAHVQTYAGYVSLKFNL